RGTILRCLALILDRGQPLPVAVAMLADHYPVKRISNRLVRAAQLIAEGNDWLKSLHKTGVVSGAEAGLLQASQRSENLVWAMHLVADGSDRRHWYRLAMGMQLLGPAVVLVAAVPIALYCIAMFLPLVQLINE